MDGKEKNTKHPALSKVLWSILFLAIAVVTIYIIVTQNRSFSFRDFLLYIKYSDFLPLLAAIICMFGFIIFEALAIRCACKPFDHKASIVNGITYSSADIYFSAITPSATGGQPASAYFMIRNGISATAATAALLTNLMMYTLAIIVIGALSFIIAPKLFFSYDILPRVFIILGIIIQLGLAGFFMLMIKNEVFLNKICTGIINFLCTIKLCRNKEKWMNKINNVMSDYGECLKLIKTHKRMMVKLFVFNVLQRISLVSVTMFVYIAAFGWGSSVKVWAMQGFAIIGSNSVPIPGAMGVADYLMLSGFVQFMSEQAATNLELLSRSLSFYFCIILCGIWVLVSYLISRGRKKKC